MKAIKVIPILIKTKSILRVGGTSVYFDFVSADLPQAKILIEYNGEEFLIPYIPATTFKGILRSTVETTKRKKDHNAISDLDKKIEEFLANIGDASRIFIDLFLDEMELLVYSKKISLKDGLDKLKELRSEDIRSKLKDKNSDKYKLVSDLLRSYFEVTGYNTAASCYSTSDLDKCENIALLEDERKRQFREAWNKLTGRDVICETCRLYGASGVKSLVRFTNFYPVDPFPVVIDRLVHVSIDRNTWAASPNKLFNEEVLYPGVKFLGFALLLSDKKESQLMNDLDTLKEKAESFEVSIGARGSSGYGTFELQYGTFAEELSEKSLLGKGKFNFSTIELKITNDNSQKGDEGKKDIIEKLSIFYPKYLLKAISVSQSVETASKK